jgi:hypothetical protein
MMHRHTRFYSSQLHRRSWRRAARLIFTLAALSALPACVPLAGLMGLGPSAVQVATQADQLKLMVDGASIAGSGKTLTDHALTIATGYDCSLTYAFKGEQVCAAMCR